MFAWASVCFIEKVTFSKILNLKQKEAVSVASFCIFPWDSLINCQASSFMAKASGFSFYPKMGVAWPNSD